MPVSLPHPSLPLFLPPLSSLSRAMKIGVWSDTLSQMELTDLVRWVVRPRLMAVPGVLSAEVTTPGLNVTPAAKAVLTLDLFLVSQ